MTKKLNKNVNVYLIFITDIYDFSTTTAGSHAGGASDTVGYEQAVSTQPAFYDSLNDQAEAAAAGAGGNTSVA